MERRIKIVFTVINDLSYDQRMHRICSSLSSAGYDVMLVGRTLPASMPLPAFPFATKRIRNFFNTGKLFYLEYNIRLFFFLLFHNCDIQGAVDLDTLAANTLSSRIRNRKLTFDAHEYFTEVPEVYNRKTVKKIWESVARYGIPAADVCYTVSPGLAELFHQQYGKEFYVVRNVPVKTTVTANTAGSPHIILYQGALNEGRCLEQLFSAVKGLDVKVWVAGEGDLSHFLRKYVTDSGQQEQVIFLGHVSPDELKKLTPKADIGFNALENNGLSYYYSLANKCFDYIQAGIPVMCSPFPEYISLNNEFPAFIFVQPETYSIRQAIINLLNDKTFYQQLKEASTRAALNWTWENEEKKLLEIYEQIR